MWALCPPSYHDNDMPIDLRKKVVLQRELDEQREYYRGSDNVYAPKDYSIKEHQDKWQQPSVLPVANLYPFVAEKYGSTVLQTDDKDKPQDLRPAIRGTLETAIKKLHINSKLKKQVQENGREERCRSTDALLEEGSSKSLKRPSRSSSCPDLTAVEQTYPSSAPNSVNPSNGEITPEIKNYPEYNGYSPESEDINSPVIGGAKKRKCFIPLYGDRAPVYERAYRSPSPQNLVCSERGYRSPSPKRPIYSRNGYHSPSPENHPYRERIYRSPSPQHLVYNDRLYYSPSPTRSYNERTYHSPSPKKLVYSDRGFRSPSPKRPLYGERGFRSPSPKRPLYNDRGFRSPSPRPLYGDRGFRSPSPKRRPKSPSEHPPYDEYFSHPEVLLRRQLSQHSTSPYFLHVYDYYQHLVQRLREHSSPTVRISSPISPTQIEEDTNPDAQRKRPCRALTGKHVRQGTGASLSTLLTLRQKIQERQKAKEHQPRNALNGINGKNSVAKKTSPKKMKMNMKTTLGKLQNC